MSAGWVIHVVTYVSSRLMVLSTNKHMDIATSTLSCWHPACGHPSCGVDTFACWYGIGFVLAMQVLLLLHLVSYNVLLFLLTSNRHNEQTHHASTNAHTIYRFYIEVFWAPNLVKISMCMYIYGANIYLYISIYKYLFVYICVCFSYCFYVGIP